MIPVAAAAIPFLTTLGSAAAAAAPAVAAGAGAAGMAAGAGYVNALSRSGDPYGPGSAPGPYAHGQAPGEPYGAASRPGPYAMGQAEAPASGGGFDWRGAIRGALRNLQGDERQQLMGAIDQPLPAGGGVVPGLTPPQFGVAERLIQRTTTGRNNWGGSVPGLGY